MALYPEQLPVLKAAILAETDPAFVISRNGFATYEMADFFNKLSTFTVWRTSLPQQELTGQGSPEVTVWSWTLFINRSAGERDGFRTMFNGTYMVNPSLPQVRAGMGDIFSGPGAANNTHFIAMSKRLAKKGENLYATGTGTPASPGLLTFEGSIDGNDVLNALTQGA